MMPTVEFKTGLKAANFSSPHKFHFDDGSVLGACDRERSEMTMMDTEERVVSKANGTSFIVIRHKLNSKLRHEIFEAAKWAMLNGVRIVIVPYPVIRAMAADDDRVIRGLINPDNPVKFATIRLADRAAEPKINRHDSFCVAELVVEFPS